MAKEPKRTKRTLTHRSVVALLMPSGQAAKWLLLLAVGGLIFAASSGHINPAVEFLSRKELTFRFASHPFTAYDVVKGMVALFVVIWGAAIVSDFLENRINRIRRLRVTTRALFGKIAQIVTYIIAFLLALDIIGIDLTALTIFSGAVGIGLGFGLQKIASNFMSGLILLFEKTISPDDIIELMDGTSGHIRRTGARFTLLETFDGKEIMIPNEEFITNRVTNLTYTNKQGRINIRVGVSYDSDIHQARRLMLEVALAHPKCLTDPAPLCSLTEFADSAVMFTLSFWVEDVNDGTREPQSEVMFAIWDAFRAHGIKMPYPHREVYLRQDPKAALPSTSS